MALDFIIDASVADQRNVSSVTSLFRTLRPETINFYSIFPLKNDTILVGFVGVAQYWDEAFKKASTQSAHGIDFILTDSKSTYTFTITKGRVVSLKGEGDLHDIHFNSYRRSYPPFGRDEYSAYTVTYYPNSAFFPSDFYVQPLIGCIAPVIVLLFLELLFAVYSYYLKRQLQQMEEALNSKRSFVRLISHEIRTPLNTVCMGLKLLQEEAQTSVDVKLLTSLLTDQVDSELIGTSPVKSPPEGETTERVKAEAMLVALLTKHKKWQELLKDIEESSNNAVTRSR
jgi:hypothetical protein